MADTEKEPCPRCEDTGIADDPSACSNPECCPTWWVYCDCDMGEEERNDGQATPAAE